MIHNRIPTILTPLLKYGYLRPYQRYISFTNSRRAGEDPQSFITRFHNSPLFHKLADKPEALKALDDFAALLKDSGIKFSPDSPPTTMQIFKLAANPKFKESAKRIVVELRKAGIDMTSENALELLTGKKS